MVPCSGGVFVMFPYYIFSFGSGGDVIMNYKPRGSEAGMSTSLDTWSVKVGGETSTSYAWNIYVIADTKIVKGMNILASTPNCYLWSLNSVLRCNIDKELPYFSTVAANVSIMAPESVVGIDNNFFWIGKNCFYQLSSSHSELVNDTNKDWFFENVNWAFAQKIFGVVNRRFSEIWWYFPLGDSEICNHIIIYNYLTQCWSDTPFEESFCGLEGVYTNGHIVSSISKQSINLPDYGVQEGAQDEEQTLEIRGQTVEKEMCTVSLHEQGTDYVDNSGKKYPLYSSVRYSFATLYSQTTSVSESWMKAARIEIDAKIEGSFTAQLIAMAFPQDYQINSYREPHYHVKDNPSLLKNYIVTPLTRYVDFSIQGRLLSLKIWCAAIGDTYHMGNMMLNWQQGSGNSGAKYITVPDDSEHLVEDDEESKERDILS